MARTIDIRDRRIPGGRVTLSSRTDDALEFEVRKAAVRDLLGEGERGLAILAALREGRLSIEDVTEKVRAKRFADLAAELEQKKEEEQVAAAPDPIMLGATNDRFLRRVEAKLSAGTLGQYRSFCLGLEGAVGVKRDAKGKVAHDIAVADVNTAQGEAWLHGPKPQRKKGAPDRPWSASRQNTAHACVLQVWALAIEEDEERAEKEGMPRTLTRNIWAKGKARIRPPKVRKTRVVFLSRRQAGRLLWAMRGRPHVLLMALGLYAGLRASEARHLRRGVDVRMKARELVIQPREGKYPWHPKTDNSVREVPVNRQLARWIRAHERMGYAGETYLIRPPGADRPISPKTQNRWTVTAFSAAGIAYGRDDGDGSTFHTLRHTFASWLAQKDVQLLKIAALMGDTHDEVQKTYAHLTPKDLRGAVDLLARKGR